MTPENYRKKLEELNTKNLKKKAIEVFNKYIRERDKDKPCISCGSWAVLEAGHYHSAGNYESTRFNEFNVSGQCKKCNRFLHGNLIWYGKGLVKRYGQEEYDKLDVIMGLETQMGRYGRDRITLIELIMKYREKNK